MQYVSYLVVITIGPKKFFVFYGFFYGTVIRPRI